MDFFLALLRLAVERGWIVGLLLMVFFGLDRLGAVYGLPLPEEVSKWANAGLAFGIATFLASIAANLIRLARSTISNRRDAAEVRRAAYSPPLSRPTLSTARGISAQIIRGQQRG